MPVITAVNFEVELRRRGHHFPECLRASGPFRGDLLVGWEEFD